MKRRWREDEEKMKRRSKQAINWNTVSVGLCCVSLHIQEWYVFVHLVDTCMTDDCPAPIYFRPMEFASQTIAAAKSYQIYNMSKISRKKTWRSETTNIWWGACTPYKHGCHLPDPTKHQRNTCVGKPRPTLVLMVCIPNLSNKFV